MNDLIIKQKVEDLIATMYVVLRQFPRSERHVLSQEIRLSLWRLLRLIIICNRRYHKKTTLQDLDAELDLLRVQVRLAFNLKFLALRKYENLSRDLDEVGRMVGGWIKSRPQKTN